MGGFLDMAFEESESDNESSTKKNNSKLSKTPTIRIEVTSLVAQKILKEKVAAGPGNTEVGNIVQSFYIIY